jgi:O-acetyl-ADP-ribose deacetylase (regulator of RNase III)
MVKSPLILWRKQAMVEVSGSVNATKIVLVQGDITKQEVDVIVNAANSTLMGGGGVDGAIHRAGGPAILEECKQIRHLHGSCAPGNAVITTGGKLLARYVIHAVGPIWRDGTTDEDTTLANAYRNSLNLAVDNELRTIAFPSISTGAYGYPVEKAANVALTTVREFCSSQSMESALTEVRFVLFDQLTLQGYADALRELVVA